MPVTEKFEGLVIKKRLWAGTKSEHEAVVLSTRNGDYKLRRQGGNPFQDDALEKLVGCRIQCEGLLRDQQIIMMSWMVMT
jgi:hypothetical protein